MNDLLRPFPATYWIEPGRFLAGEYPGRPHPLLLRQRIVALLQHGFDTYIDLTRPDEREPYLPTLLEEARYYDLAILHQRFPIGDFGLPTHAQMSDILAAIESALSSGRKIYLHCWAGVGRTGTTVGCYLVERGMSGEQALARLAELFQTAEQSSYFAASPETYAQANFVLQWKPRLATKNQPT